MRNTRDLLVLLMDNVTYNGYCWDLYHINSGYLKIITDKEKIILQDIIEKINPHKFKIPFIYRILPKKITHSPLLFGKNDLYYYLLRKHYWNSYYFSCKKPKDDPQNGGLMRENIRRDYLFFVICNMDLFGLK